MIFRIHQLEKMLNAYFWSYTIRSHKNTVFTLILNLSFVLRYLLDHPLIHYIMHIAYQLVDILATPPPVGYYANNSSYEEMNECIKIHIDILFWYFIGMIIWPLSSIIIVTFFDSRRNRHTTIFSSYWCLSILMFIS